MPRVCVLFGLSTLLVLLGGRTREAHAQTPAPVVVSFTFDDGRANQAEGRALLARHGMRGTFYVNSGRIGQSTRLTLAQLQAFQAEGHEIGGHTVSHPRLTDLDPGEQARQICDERVALSAAGLTVTSFAYPYGALDATTRRLVMECGYNSGRDSAGLLSPGGCANCPVAELVPPRDPYVIRVFSSVDSTTTLQDLQDAVTRAEQGGGGWVTFVIHDVCDGCGSLSITPATLDAFLAWLAPRAVQGTTVRTVHEVMGGPVHPPVPGPPPPERPDASQLLFNPSLEEDANGDALPDCWMRKSYGDVTAVWSEPGDAPDGSRAAQVTITRHVSGDVKLISSQDLGACAPPARPGHRYRARALYRTDGPARFAAYYRTAAGGWVWWAQGPLLPHSASYVTAEWTTPPAPAEATAISVGLSLIGPGTLAMDAHALEDLTPLRPVIRFGDTWKYEASGLDPGAGWYLAGFDDSAWGSGAGQLGYGDRDETTVLPATTPAQTSVYFRKKVTLDGPAVDVTLSAIFDDGIAVWVNGTLVLTRNMGVGTAHAKYATASAENERVDVTLPPEVFVQGENTVSVMVKQNGRTSPDLSFDLKVDVARAPPG
ncbi:polysaccharide deacetylase family protein [Pyxidicoccus fallax]|uniref:Polysaccharide deacetylase family protein n=1 Tax=Pyxidicoccus fallax TaxID=394095 RepID=A0A848LBT1_9BACT|nr:polysaccharide deacetylase family protein [Pyxidicoccus fallax]NMO14285.1 polysaccharide deacetylase family protein [Pyxidicoccus fallax]NPC79910.1 polysaccharide deacetylase family protein [Pyxidicoccus fallax]